MKPTSIIKICVDPHCEAVYHNCNLKQTKCNDCEGRIIMINEKTYLEKFQFNFIQYDINTMKYFRPKLELTLFN